MQNEVCREKKKGNLKNNIVRFILLIVLAVSTLGLLSGFKKVKIESVGEYFKNRTSFKTEQVAIGKELFKKYRDISDYKYNRALSSLNYLPKELLYVLKDSKLDGVISDASVLEYTKDIGVKIKVDEKLKINHDEIQALYMPSHHHIFVSSKLDNIFNFRLDLVHEIGHAFDCLNMSDTKGRLCKEDDFMSIYNKSEKDVLFDYDDYYTRSEEEYFAESFALYYINPTYLKNKAPATYKYFDNLLVAYNN